MIAIIFSLLAIFIVLVISESLWRKHKLSDELTRKIVHIFVAVFVAFWPFYMSYNAIKLLALAFLVVIVISRQLHIFKGILHVKRKTYGDIFFPLSILSLAILEPASAIFMIAMLHIGLSDGIAALIGKKYGKKNQYKVFGQTKSFVGTLSFILISYLILLSVKLINPSGITELTWQNVLILPPILGFIENISVYGADDLTVPLVLLVVLKWF